VLFIYDNAIVNFDGFIYGSAPLPAFVFHLMDMRLGVALEMSLLIAKLLVH
jgi:hypothetical protein